MGAALSYHKTGDDPTATRARFTGAAEDLEFVPVAAPMAGNGVKCRFTGTQRGAQVAQPATEHFTDGPMQATNFGVGQLIRCPGGMEAGIPQGFIDIDVAQPGQEVLVQQQGFELAAVRGQSFFKLPGGKLPGKGFRSQAVEYGRAVRKIESAEFAGVMISQLPFPVYDKRHVVVLAIGGARAAR